VGLPESFTGGMAGAHPQQPQFTPTQGSANPQPQFQPGMDIRPQARELRGLSPAFVSIEDQLSKRFPEAIAKLRDPGLDYTRAMISIRPRGGKQSQFMPLADFVITDFAEACALEARQGGPLTVTVEPNDGVRPRFVFGFDAPHVDIAPESVNKTLQDQVDALKLQIQRDRELAELGRGGGAAQMSEDEREMKFLQKMQMYKNIFAPAGTAAAPVDPMKMMQDTMNMTGNMVGAALGMVKNVGQATQALNPAASAGAVAAAEANAWMGVVKEGMPVVKELVPVVIQGVQAMKGPAGESAAAAAAVADVA